MISYINYKNKEETDEELIKYIIKNISNRNVKIFRTKRDRTSLELAINEMYKMRNDASELENSTFLIINSASYDTLKISKDNLNSEFSSKYKFILYKAEELFTYKSKNIVFIDNIDKCMCLNIDKMVNNYYYIQKMGKYYRVEKKMLNPYMTSNYEIIGFIDYENNTFIDLDDESIIGRNIQYEYEIRKSIIDSQRILLPQDLSLDEYMESILYRNPSFISIIDNRNERCEKFVKVNDLTTNQNTKKIKLK